MDASFWLGLLFAIPVGILTNIATPHFEKFLGRWNKNVAAFRKRKLLQELAEIQTFSENRQEFSEYLLIMLFKVLLTAFLSLAAAGLLFAFEQLADASLTPLTLTPLTFGFYGNVFLSTINGFGQLSVSMGAIIVVILCRETLIKYEKVKEFTNYEEGVRKILGEERTDAPK